MNTTTKMIIGLTVAAAAGAAIGMLMAPEKGSDLQKKIKDGASDWMKNFSSLLLAGKDVINELKTRAGDEYSEETSERIGTV